MGRARIAFLLIFTFLCGAGIFLTARNWSSVADAKAVPAGHQEVAWMAPATSGDSWERLVAALALLQNEQGDVAGHRFRVDMDNAFLALTAEVPEVGLYFEEAPEAKLWIRWYKLTKENPSQRWLEKLSSRGQPPLAVIGGDTSDRALHQSLVLEAARARWAGPAPLYFITTATADRYEPPVHKGGEVSHGDWPKLMEVYAQRTFRFCFTNSRMVQAVLDFVHQNRLTDPLLDAAVVSQGSPYASLGLLSLAGLFRPYYSSTLIWKDDSYSKDLGEIFLDVFARQARPGSEPFAAIYNNFIDYSVGGFLEPNPSEAQQVGLYLANNPTFRDQPQLLALPTGTQPARRFLRALCRRAPLETRNVVVVTGDGIAFNSIHRDRNLAWNIQDLPVSLVCFSHRDPVDRAAGFGAKRAGDLIDQTGTQDVLLFRDIAEALVGAAFDRGRLRCWLVPDADALRERLIDTRWRAGRIQGYLDHAEGSVPGVPFFDASGNRRSGTGEHVVWLRPVFEGNRNLPEAYITIWSSAEQPSGTWRQHGPALHVLYDQPGP